MKCIYCSHKVTSVKNSRSAKGGTLVWRRRYCEKCKNTFTTREGTFLDNLFLIKRNGKRQRFLYEKLFASIFSALNFGKERDSGSQSLVARDIAYTAIDVLRAPQIKTTSTKEVIITVYKELMKVNQHAAYSYMFYSSYRRDVLKRIGTIMK